MLEFESEVPKNHQKYLKTVVAFANSKGGRIIFGVDDHRNITGLEGDPYRIHDAIVDSIVSECQPRVDIETEVIEVEGKALIIIEVSPGTARPYHLRSLGEKDGVFIRIGASSRMADEDTVKELMLEGMKRYFDEVPAVGRTLDPSSDAVNGLCARISSAKGGPCDVNSLMNLNLVSEADGAIVPNRGFLLLTDNPYYHARVQCARFKGTDKSVFIDRKEFTGPLEEQIRDSVNFVLNHINYGSTIVGTYRRDSYEIPPEAIREVITNAVAHRSYLREDSPILLAVYDDRITVVSPGPFPSSLTLEKALEGRTQSRNRAISRYFREIGLMEGWGSGLRRIMSSCREHGLRPPRILDDGSFVEVTLYRRQTQDSEITENEGRLVTLIEKCPSMTVKNASRKLELSEATVNRMLKRLQEKGVLHREGSRKTGEWVLDQIF